MRNAAALATILFISPVLASCDNEPEENEAESPSTGEALPPQEGRGEMVEESVDEATAGGTGTAADSNMRTGIRDADDGVVSGANDPDAAPPTANSKLQRADPGY